METKYFKKIYSNYTGYGKWQTGDGENYHEPEDGKYIVEFITEQEYIDGVLNMPPIPKTKKQLIEEKKNEIAIEELKKDKVLDKDGNLII